MIRIPSADRPFRGAWLALLVGVACAAGCLTPDQHRDEADREVYQILEERRAQLGLGEKGFTIAPPPDSLRQRLLRGEVIGPVDLPAVLSVAAENSRDYQRRREDLYLSALDLTLERFRYQVQKNGSVGALLAGDGAEATSAAGTGSVGFSKLLGTGAAIVGDLGLSIARDLTQADGWDLTSNFVLTITQPLLRGFGERIVMEPLTQAERDVVYQVRTFERFRRTFAVDTASRYLRILQQMDRVENERLNMENLIVLRQRNEALAQAGRLSSVEVDQTTQDELTSTSRLISAESQLTTLLDDFKLYLGLPIDARLELMPSELERLTQIDDPQISEARAIEIALADRLDFLTALDQVDDSTRHLDIAADNLRSSLDVVMRVGGTSAEGQPADYGTQDLNWTLSAQLDLPIDIVQERNAYRSSIIALERSRRSADELADSIRADLRSELREAELQTETLRIQEGAVKLAEQRVESTNLNRQAGRAQTRDILDAQESLRSARNSLTGAAIDHHLSRLNLWRDMELIRVDENGVGLDRERLLAPTKEQP